MIYLILTWLAAPWLWWRARRRYRSATPARVLVIQTAKIGDFVATTPVFSALRQGLPASEIVVLIHPVNEPLATLLPSIDRIVTLPERGAKGWAGKRWLLAQLVCGYDVVLVLSPSLTYLLAPFWAGIPVRVAVLPDRRRGSARLAWPFLTHGERHKPGQLFRDTALHALVGIGLEPRIPPVDHRPYLAKVASGEAKVGVFLGGMKRPLVGLGLGAGNQMKALSVSQLIMLSLGMVEREAATVVLIGTASDSVVAQEMLLRLPREHCVDLTGRCGLEELPTLLASLDCYVGVDSGATYIADAMGVPVVDFMGPADADDQRPTGDMAIVIRSSEPCAPCSHAFDAPYRCRLGTRACINGAPVEAMIAEVSAILSVKFHRTP